MCSDHFTDDCFIDEAKTKLVIHVPFVKRPVPTIFNSSAKNQKLNMNDDLHASVEKFKKDIYTKYYKRRSRPTVTIKKKTSVECKSQFGKMDFFSNIAEDLLIPKKSSEHTEELVPFSYVEYFKKVRSFTEKLNAQTVPGLAEEIEAIENVGNYVEVQSVPESNLKMSKVPTLSQTNIAAPHPKVNVTATRPIGNDLKSPSAKKTDEDLPILQDPLTIPTNNKSSENLDYYPALANGTDYLCTIFQREFHGFENCLEYPDPIDDMCRLCTELLAKSDQFFKLFSKRDQSSINLTKIIQNILPNMVSLSFQIGFRYFW